MENQNNTALLVDESAIKEIVKDRYDGCCRHKAFPDQLHTFVGDCSSDIQTVVLVPEGDVKFSSNKINGNNIIVVIGEKVSADYLEFLEDMQISYIFAGYDGRDENVMKMRLRHDFGIEHLIDYNKGKVA